jgi:hypothetical protein
MTRQGIPFRPDYAAARNEHARSFWRAMTGEILGHMRNEAPQEIIARTWRGDESSLRMLTRTAVPVAATTTTDKMPLVPIAMLGALPILAPRSASAVLADKALSLGFDRVNQVLVPKVTTGPTAAWIGEGSPLSVVTPVLGGVIVGPPRTINFSAAITSELANCSPDIAVPIIRETITRAAIKALDTALLDATAADTTRPAGLLLNISDLGATAGGGLAALTADLGKLAAAIATADIFAEDLVLCMNPADAIKARGLLSPAFANTYTIVGTSAVSSGTIVALAPSAIATFFGTPQLDVTKDALVSMATDPADIVAGGALKAGTDVKSAWQADLLVLRLRLRATWAPLATAAVQKITSVTW